MASKNRLLLSIIFVLTLVAVAKGQTVMDPDPPLLVGTVQLHPYLFIEPSDDQTKGTVYRGFVKDIMEKVSAMSGVDYQFVERPDSRFGHLRVNGTWGGLVGDLIRQEVDLVAAPLTETADRVRVVSFSTWFQNFGSVVVMKHFPQKVKFEAAVLASRLYRLFEPLSDSVWLLSLLAWLMTSITLYFISYVNPYDWRRMCRDREATMREGESFTCLNSFWFTLSAIFWQGYLRCPRSIGARIVVLSWWMYSLIFVSMYISSLTNFLQVGPVKQVDEIESIKIDNIVDLAYQKRITFGLLEKGSTFASFQNSRNPHYKRMWAKIVKNPSAHLVPSIDAGIEKVRSSSAEKPFAFIMESAMAKFYVNEDPCDIYMVKDYTSTGSYSFAFNIHNTTLEAIVDVALLTLRETGELQQLEDYWFPENLCPENETSSTTPTDSKTKVPLFYQVDLASFSGALILIVIGLVCGAIVTGLEICIYKYAETGTRDRNAGKKPLNEAGTGRFMNDSERNRDDPEPMTDV